MHEITFYITILVILLVLMIPIIIRVVGFILTLALGLIANLFVAWVKLVVNAWKWVKSLWE